MVNPAQTGFFQGNYRFTGLYRSQWSSVPVDYKSIEAGFDTKLQPHFLSERSLVGLGINLLRDEAGDASLSNSMVAIQSSFHKHLSDEISIGIGAHIALHQRSGNPNAVKWESQYDGDQFDPSLFSGESLTSQSDTYVSAGAGLLVSYQVPDRRNNYVFGLSEYHLNSPQFSFYDFEQVKVLRKLNLIALSTFEINPGLDAQLNILYSHQGPYKELLTEGLLRKYLSIIPSSTFQILGGIGIRWNDAIYPKLGIRINNTEAGFSYDLNFSEWKKASLKRGGPEFFIQHILWKVEPPTEFKPCPIF